MDGTASARISPDGLVVADAVPMAGSRSPIKGQAAEKEDEVSSSLTPEHVSETALVRDHVVMQIRPGLQIDDNALASFAARHAIRRLALFGSVLRDDFGPDSDIDVLVEFEPGRSPGLLEIASMELELGELLGHEVELRTYHDLSRYFRDEVRATARELYAA